MPGKKASHRNSIIRSLIIELVRAEKIKTTPNKAKIVKSQFDKLVTMSKKETISGNKGVEAFFASNDRIISKFHEMVKTKFSDRNSGYTHLFHTLPRKGDNADQMYIMVVNYQEKEEKSNVQKLLEKRKASEEEKSVGGRIKKAVGVKPKKKKEDK
jgi:large subunit ribosomal protein L17